MRVRVRVVWLYGTKTWDYGQKRFMQCISNKDNGPLCLLALALARVLLLSSGVESADMT